MAEAIPQSRRWTGLLMAGGKSRRMGRDKAMLMFQGEPLWMRQWRTLREAGVAEVMIARGAQPWVEVEGLERVEDAEPGCGPLGGLVAALRRLNREESNHKDSKTQRVTGRAEGSPFVSSSLCGSNPVGVLPRTLLVVLAVDLPLMPAEFLRRMMEMPGQEQRGVVPMIDGRFEPLGGVYGPACLPILEEGLAAGEWSLQVLLEKCVAADAMSSFEVDEKERVYFQNVNTPEELGAVVARSSRSGGGSPP